MRKKTNSIRFVMVLVYFVHAIISPPVASAQQNILIEMAAIDGIAITPDNVFNYHIQSAGSIKVQVNGSIRYRGSGLSLTYTFPYTLKPGLNRMGTENIHPQWQFSSPALQELFFTYKVLPEGTFEYCVTVTPDNMVKENTNPFQECLYHRSGDIFVINLIYPENKAKLREYNPLLSWFANYTFASELTYRIRVAEMKQGQNPETAVMRNRPVYDENGLMQNSIMYPVYARPLEANKPYAWTVDAYYKGILLGGAECWQFIILDSLPPEKKVDRSYIDIKRETGANHLTAEGTIKLKYVLEERMTDNLHLEIVNGEGEKCRLTPNILSANYGDNRYEVDLKNNSNLKHGAFYNLKIRTETNHEYTLPFQYINPDFIR